ncbi:hypothetical protein RSW84_26190, partial [Escherichia coli]|uniref:hypothetical protein n=1 Tax=Escherichia coli TaxID=562 RepID=UPI0028DE1A97
MVVALSAEEGTILLILLVRRAVVGLWRAASTCQEHSPPSDRMANSFALIMPSCHAPECYIT